MHGKSLFLKMFPKKFRDDIVPLLDLYLDKISEVITNETVGGINPISTVNLISNADGSPRQSPPAKILEYGEDAKELLFKIASTPGVATDPYQLNLLLGAQPVKNSLNVKISENDYRTQVVEVFPLGLLDIEAMEDNLQIKPGPGDESYTGTFVACGVDSEDVYKLYQSNSLPNGNIRGNEFKRLIEDQGLLSDKIKKAREIYFEPVGDDCVKVHFGIDAEDGVTAVGLQEDMLAEGDVIALVDDEDEVVGQLSDLELSTDRRFVVEVTTDLPPGQIISRLENEPNSPEFDRIENVREEDGKTVFDFVTDRNLNIIPANFPDLEDKIDSILDSDDAKIRVPGSDLIPLRQYTGTVRISTDEETAAPILEDWQAPSVIIQELNLPSQWVVDYKAAVELDTIEAYISANISFGVRKSDISAEVGELLEENMIFTLNANRAFRGTCSILNEIEPERLNKTIHELVVGISQNLQTSEIYLGQEAIYTFGSDRRRRQAEDLEVKFYFQSLEPQYNVPSVLQAQGRRIIDNNPTFAALYDSQSLVITPQMFEEGITPVTLPTMESTVEPELTTVPPTTIIDVVTPDDGINENTAPPQTIPSDISRNAISVYKCPDEPDNTADLVTSLEDRIQQTCSKVDAVNCSNSVSRDGVFIVQCKYTISADKDTSIDDVESSLDTCLPKEVDCLKRDVTYIDENVDLCIDAFENNCDPETSICSSEDGEVVCKCREGFEKEDENDIKSACVKSGPDVVLIILIVLIVILFLVILLLSYFVHQKRTKTGMYSPAKHQPTQIQS